MVRGSGTLLKSAGAGLSATLADILVCPLSKQPLRLCEKTNSLISDSIGVSYPIVDGIPRLVPADGKMLDSDEDSAAGEINSASQKMECVRRTAIKSLKGKKPKHQLAPRIWTRQEIPGNVALSGNRKGGNGTS